MVFWHQSTLCKVINQAANSVNSDLTAFSSVQATSLWRVLYQKGKIALQKTQKRGSERPLCDTGDAVANDVKYHQKCWVLMKGTVQQKDKSFETKEIEDIHYVIADIKITKTVKAEQGDLSHKIVNTN